ncbi:MAG: hypothetical protein K6A43_04485 [Treponema sp.]|nr:hypothetical protein [Treponema sp.]
MNKHDFPQIHFYDQDFVDIYGKTWSWVSSFWINPQNGEQDNNGYFIFPENQKMEIKQFESIFSSFFLVYSNRNFDSCKNIDYFYERQEDSGAIRCCYDLKTNQPVMTPDNPEGLGLPLFAWAEFNLYHKSANKRRIKEVMPYLQKYVNWIDENFKQENGLYAVPATVSTMFNSPRKDCVYPVDFNACMAINASYMSALGDILNDKELSFQYKRMYFSIKTRINSLMWDADTNFYYDLNANQEKLSVKTLAAYWTMLAEVPNADKADALVEHLNDPNSFGTEHPFPTLSVDNPEFSEDGNGFCGSVYPAFNFMVIKGLEKYGQYELARECAIRHLYFVLEGLMPNENKEPGDLWEAYLPNKEGLAKMDGSDIFPRKRYLITAALSTIALMIENVIGLSISLPRKTVDWIIPNLEIMGIEKLSLKRNLITILSNKSTRGWEIQMESEKLYYFTINILDQKKKTLPIPSGKCSMLIDKL